MSKTTIYRYNEDEQLVSVKTVDSRDREKVIHVWRRGDSICYSVTRGSKLQYAIAIKIPEVRRKLKAMRAVFYPFSKHTLIELLAFSRKAKGHR